jgi:hypothetical protein
MTGSALERLLPHPVAGGSLNRKPGITECVFCQLLAHQVSGTEEHLHAILRGPETENLGTLVIEEVRVYLH